MAIESYKNAKIILSDSNATKLYETPTIKTAVVHAVFFANLSSLDLRVTLIVESSDISYVIGNQIKIRKNTSLSWDKPINLAPTEKLLVQSSSVVGDITVFASVLELEFGV